MAPSRLHLPPSIAIRPLSPDEAVGLALDAVADRYLLTDDEDPRRTFVVNAVIRDFLELFRTPSSPEAAAERLAARTGCPADTLLPRIAEFSRHMRRQGVLRRESAACVDAAPPPILAAGAHVGPYTIDECIAETAHAVVYRGHDAAGCAVALKALAPHYATHARAWDDFRCEVALLRTLPPHAHICRLLDYVEAPLPIAVLEFVDGTTLHHAARDPALPLDERISMGDGVLAGMAHLHRRGVLHGDVHARNFLRTADGRVKLIDLGFARRSDEAAGTSVHGGLPEYMPPERVGEGSLSISSGPGDERAEVYQLGVVLYELLVGARPYRTHARWRALAADIRAGRLLPLAHTPDGEPIPAPLRAVVVRALALAPTARHANAGALRRAWRVAARRAGVPLLPSRRRARARSSAPVEGACT
jgi:serine/threonine-protein kinase